MLTIVDDAQPNLSAGEKFVKVKSWARILEGIIPEVRLPDVFKHAFENHWSTFPINHYDLKNSWCEIKENERKLKAKSAKKVSERETVANCKNKHLHIVREDVPDSGEIYHWNWINQNEDLISPCFDCRQNAYKDWRRRVIEKSGLQPEPVEKLTNVPVFKKREFAEIRLSFSEIEDLLNQHNSLVHQLVEDVEARRNLELVFDEGANVFKLPHRADLTYTAEIVKKKVASYKDILISGMNNKIGSKY